MGKRFKLKILWTTMYKVNAPRSTFLLSWDIDIWNQDISEVVTRPLTLIWSCIKVTSHVLETIETINAIYFQFQFSLLLLIFYLYVDNIENSYYSTTKLALITMSVYHSSGLTTDLLYLFRSIKPFRYYKEILFLSSG